MFTICTDTICEGYSPILQYSAESSDKGVPVQFDTEEEAEAEIKSDPEFYEDCFVCPMEDIGHKTIYYGG